MIFKVQLSLASSDGIERILIYNEGRTITGHVVADEHLKRLLGGEKKKFIRGKYDPKSGRISLDDPVGDRDW